VQSTQSKRWRFLALAAVVASTGPLSAAHGSRHSLRIENRSLYDIRHLYFASSDGRQWGPDMLRVSLLASGADFTLSNISTGEYNVRFVDSDGDECTLTRINISTDTAWKLTTEWLLGCEGYRRHGRHLLSIENDSTFAIQQIRLASNNSGNWGPDTLGSSVLKPGARHIITDIPTGSYGLKFVDQDGDECVFRPLMIIDDMSWRLNTDFLLRCEGYARHRVVR
jgi:hypothetical protein